MALKRFLRCWPYLAGLLGLSALAVILLLGGVIQAPSASAISGAAVEVITDHPLHVEHQTPVSMVNRAEAASAARVDIPVDFYDFGSISPQAVVQRAFLVINQGSAPLVIWQAYTTCGCMTANLTASVIPPGKASRVTVIFDAGFHPVAGQTVRRGLVLETNDPDRPEADIWVQASVR